MISLDFVFAEKKCSQNIAHQSKNIETYCNRVGRELILSKDTVLKKLDAYNSYKLHFRFTEELHVNAIFFGRVFFCWLAVELPWMIL